jgi:outer membrane protein assembly factor BamE (lipoprotein component of BamABCDE complex)
MRFSHKLKALIPIIALAFLICSSQSFADTVDFQKSNLTYGIIKSKLKKGETSQNDILQLIGSPNIVTKNRSGKEVWTYDKISSDAHANVGYGSLVVLGGAFANSSSSSKSVTLMITFDDKDVIEDYSFIQSAY